MFGSVCCRECKKIDGMKAGSTPAKPTWIRRRQLFFEKEISSHRENAGQTCQHRKKSSEKKKKARYYQQKKSLKAVLEEVKRQRLLRAEQDAVMARQQGFLSAEAKRSAAYRLRKNFKPFSFLTFLSASVRSAYKENASAMEELGVQYMSPRKKTQTSQKESETQGESYLHLGAIASGKH